MDQFSEFSLGLYIATANPTKLSSPKSVAFVPESKVWKVLKFVRCADEIQKLNLFRIRQEEDCLEGFIIPNATFYFCRTLCIRWKKIIGQKLKI